MKILAKTLILTGLLAITANNLSASPTSSTQYVDVISSEPIYKTINVRVPYEEVVSKSYTVKVPCGQSYSEQNQNSIGIDTIIGAGLGVALGHQVGKGSGKTAAKVLGGLLGAGIANGNRAGQYQTNYCNETRYRDEVVTRYDYVTEKKIQGYLNKFIFNGVEHTKRTNRPQKVIKIRTTISF